MPKSLYPQPRFASPWHVTGAVARLLLDDEKYQVPALFRIWRRTVEEWVHGSVTHSLMGLDLPSEVRIQLRDDLNRIRDALTGLLNRGWKRRETMPSVVWMRLFAEAGVQISQAAAVGYARWSARGLSEQKLWLCQYRRIPKKWSGPKVFRNAPKPAVGYLLDELLWRPAPPDSPRWPYDCEWRLVRRAPFDTGERLVAGPSAIHSRRRNGGRLFEAMQELVFQAKIDMPDAIRDGEGRMVTTLTLVALAERMKARYPVLKNYAITSIKGSLGPLVKAPRGHPRPKLQVKTS
ncbi:MAG: hypothetical protein EON54_00955 [Alcaligenaceae bacterium]|nr:MAG: hypothetical protein EON54_00955 [Alcaligenaceae bacterium]